MKIIKTVIADNEPLALKQLESFLSESDGIEIVASCQNGKEALEAIKKSKPELVFLDIEMPELSGIEIMETLDDNTMPFVVFVTAFDEYAIQAFEIDALDYLLKPYNKKRFEDTLLRARKYIDQFNNAENTSGNKSEEYLNRLLIKTSKKMFFLEVENIICIEASGNYAKINTLNHSYLIRSTLKYLEQKLDPRNFARVHKSSIVNLNKVKELEQWFTGDYEILLNNGEKIKMSRNYREVLERFK